MPEWKMEGLSTRVSTALKLGLNKLLEAITTHSTGRLDVRYPLEETLISTEDSSTEASTTDGTTTSEPSKAGYWYIATAYTKHPEGTDAAFNQAAEAQAKLANVGIVAYSPIVMGHGIVGMLTTERDHDFWMHYNLPLMVGAKGIIVVQTPGFSSSRGVREEWLWFIDNDRPALMLGYPISDYSLTSLKQVVSQFD
jgi:hypothetical protein